MRKKLILLILAILLMIPVLSRAESKNPDPEVMAEEVSNIFKKYKTVGGALVVAKDGDILYTQYYGWAYTKNKVRVSENTYFRIASATKMVSAVGVMRLVEESLLDLDEDISAYLGYTVVNPYYPNIPITLRTLMSHTSSLDTRHGYSKESNTLSFLIDKEQKHKKNFEKVAPGSKYVYSNFGAGIMGSLMECVTGKNVNDVMKSYVFDPLGIDAAFDPSLLRNPDDFASIYTRTGRVLVSRPNLTGDWDASVDPDRHYRITVGSLWIKPTELARLASMLCCGGLSDGMQFLQEETVEEMMSSQLGKGVVTVDSPYGLCINRVTDLLADRMVYGHQGLVDDVLANVYFEPQSGLVFVMVTNGCNSSMTNHIGILSRKMFGWVWENFGE